MAKITDPVRLKNRKLMRQSTLIALLGILIASLLTVLVVKQSPSIKEGIEVVPETSENLLRELTAHKKLGLGEYLPILGKVKAGDKVVFKVSVLRPTYIGLLVSTNNQKPEFVFYGRLPPGKNRLIEKQGKRYVHIISPKDKVLKFCVVYAEDKAKLQQLNNKLPIVWEALPESSCLTLEVG